MAWSPNRSNGRGIEISSFLLAHPLSRLKWMLILSGVFHVLLGLVSLVVSANQKPMRLEPVAVVNLVGGGGFPRETPKPAPPSPGPAAPPEAKAPPAAPARKDDIAVKPPRKEVKAASKKASEKKEPEIDPSAMASVSERLRRMREERDGSDSVRKAIEQRRGEAAARAAVHGVGERVARRIEGPTERPARVAGGGGGDGYGGGSRGSVRVSPELLEFFRKLEERVRESWVLPDVLVRDAGSLMVEMRIVIEKDGRVSDTRIEKGSGNVYFDESVRRAIRKASPLPIPPERLRGGEDHYEVGFRFHGNGGRG